MSTYLNQPSIYSPGESKSNLGWTPLHLASYFGHKPVVEFLLDQGADINAVNDSGDTPLHKAAFVGREVRGRYQEQINKFCLKADCKQHANTHMHLHTAHTNYQITTLFVICGHVFMQLPIFDSAYKTAD